MRELVRIFSDVNSVVFIVLALLMVRSWLVRRDAPTLWAALAFGSLGLLVAVGHFAPKHPRGLTEIEEQHLVIALFVAFPYLLYRFAMAFGQRRGRYERFLAVLTASLIVATFAAPRFPEAGEPRPWWLQVYVLWFLVHWTALSAIVSVRLWRGGKDQPVLARRRVRTLALACALLTVAIFGVAFANNQSSPAELASQLVGAASAIAFLLALSPPLAVRATWRRQEQRRVQGAIAELMGAASQQEILDLILPAISEFVGARAVSLRDGDGTVLGTHGEPDAQGTIEAISVPMTTGELLIWTTPYTPFFGEDDLAAARAVGELTLLALDRARLFSQERDARVTLERANRLMTNFVALAAHELRTPVTTIAGSAETLRARAGTLRPEQEHALIDALAGESTRMRRLVEQLLDLSRLDAEAIDITPQPLPLRERIDEIVATAAGEHPEQVDIEVDPELVVEADPAALERIVGNLVTNALRYGAAPIVVSAERSDHHLRVRVTDHGPGVPADFVPDLFERFTRQGRAAGPVTGTGLGLAIARAYARAHHGDLFYTGAADGGAAFELVLPQAPIPTPRAS